MRFPPFSLPALLVLASLTEGASHAYDGGYPATVVPTSASMPDGDAAAKHAKRTACLKEAKTRKFVGAQKAAFLKECLTAP